MSLVLQTKAIKAINKGGGRTPTTTKEKGFLFMRSGERHNGGVYIIFVCPGCQQRNRREMHQSKYYVKDQKLLAFHCNGCNNIVEVSPPENQQSIILP